MSNFVINDVLFLFNGHDLSADGSGFSFKETQPTYEDTRLTHTAKSNCLRLPEGDWSYQGFTAFGATAVESILAAHKGLTDIPVLVAKAGDRGDRCCFFRAAQAETDLVSGAVDEVSMFKVGGPLSKGGVIDGYLLASSKDTVNGAGQTTAVNVGATTSSQRVYAVIQILDFVGTDLTVKIQSDDSGGASFVDRFTEAGITESGGSWPVEISGPLTDTHWRVDFSGTFTSFRAAVAIGIR